MMDWIRSEQIVARIINSQNQKVEAVVWSRGT